MVERCYCSRKHVLGLVFDVKRVGICAEETLTGDTMARFRGNPGLVDRCAGKYHGQKIGK